MENKKFIKVFLISILVFTCIYFFIFETFLSSKAYRSNNKPSTKGEIKTDIPDYKLEKNKLTFAFLGIDTDTNKRYEGKRTDTIMLVDVDFINKDINIISIPRDTRVLKSNGFYDKINHAHAYGGVEAALDTINRLTDLNIDYYVRMNYIAVEEIIDSLGGVEVDVPFDMKYTDTTPGDELHIDIKKGKQVLNGKKSIEYLRWRKNNDGQGYAQGDMGRIEKHQDFIKTLIKQALNPINFTKLPEFTRIYNDNIDTNIPFKVMVSGVWSFKDLKINSINSHIIPGEYEYINDISYYLVDPELVQEFLRKHL